MKKLINGLLIAGLMLFAIGTATAQSTADTTHRTRAQVLNDWATSNRQMPANPYDSATWYSTWIFASDGYPTTWYFQNVGPQLAAKIVVEDTALVRGNGNAYFIMTKIVGGLTKPIFTKFTSKSFTAENDTVTTVQNVPFVGITSTTITRDTVIVKAVVGVTNPSTSQTVKKAPAGTVIYGRFSGQ